MNLSIRPLTEADLDSANEVLYAAYDAIPGQPTELAHCLKLQPNGWRLAVFGDLAVGVGGAVDYGPFSYIGLVGVVPEMQRHGIGRALMEHLIDWLHTRQCPSILLDASAAGTPLYEHLGFVTDDRVTLLRCDSINALAFPPPPPHYRELISEMKESDFAAVIAYDWPRFGAERPAMLASYLADYPHRAFVARNRDGKVSGFLFAQERRIGPWVAETYDDAERLLLHALTLPFEGNAPAAIIPVCNRDAERLLTRYGFRPLRTLRHMRLGELVRRERTKIYGQASFALG
jgi:GNAT superfamily N-acetyltransferase